MKKHRIIHLPTGMFGNITEEAFSQASKYFYNHKIKYDILISIYAACINSTCEKRSCRDCPWYNETINRLTESEYDIEEIGE